jgi:hypothetical protein
MPRQDSSLRACISASTTITCSKRSGTFLRGRRSGGGRNWGAAGKPPSHPRNAGLRKATARCRTTHGENLKLHADQRPSSETVREFSTGHPVRHRRPVGCEIAFFAKLSIHPIQVREQLLRCPGLRNHGHSPALGRWHPFSRDRVTTRRLAATIESGPPRRIRSDHSPRIRESRPQDAGRAKK